jgi:hypothetical protein
MSRLRFSLLLTTLAVLAIPPSSAQAETGGTGWEAFAQAYPTNLHPGGKGTIQIDLMNTGAKRSNGAITVTDTLPKGVIATVAGGLTVFEKWGNEIEPEAEEIKQFGGKRWNCEVTGTQQDTVTCTSNPEYLNGLPKGAGNGIEPIERIAVEIEVRNGTPEGTFANRVTVAGGGAIGVIASSDQLTLSSSEPRFGFSGWGVWFSNADGTIGTQAGSHPYETTFALGFNALGDGGPAGGEARNLEIELPPGFSGEPNSAPRCTRTLLDAEACPADTVIGDDVVMLAAGTDGPNGYTVLPLYNMVPPEGIVDEFALKIAGKPTYFDTGPRGYGNYALITHVDDIPAIDLADNILTLWGVAPEASHNSSRLAYGESQENKECAAQGCPSNAPPRPFLTLPTSCGPAQEFTIDGLSTWEDGHENVHASSATQDALGEPAGFTGCSNLSFNAGFSAAPETSEADTPAGLSVNVSFPQEALRVPGTLVEANVKNTTVRLPPGLVINPGQAAGLQAC